MVSVMGLGTILQTRPRKLPRWKKCLSGRSTHGCGVYSYTKVQTVRMHEAISLRNITTITFTGMTLRGSMALRLKQTDIDEVVCTISRFGSLDAIVVPPLSEKRVGTTQDGVWK